MSRRVGVLGVWHETNTYSAHPTTLAELAEVMKKLGPDADRVQVLFVTVDPERDTPELLGKYVPAFDPRFAGLYGDAVATERTAKEFKIIYQKRPGPTPTSKWRAPSSSRRGN